MRKLEAEIGRWRARMAAGGIKSPAVLDELESHLREEIERQMRSGADELKAFELAAQKIGGSDMLKAEFAKIRRFPEVPIGKLVGGACCITAAVYSMALAPALLTVRELGFGQRLLGLGGFLLTLLFLASLRFGPKFLPVIRNRRARIASVSACALAGFVWLVAFSNLLPDVIVPHWMHESVSYWQATHPISADFGPQTGSLQTRNQVSLGGDSRLAQPGYRGRVARQNYVAHLPPLTAVFDIGISLFWAMTLAAALGGLAYGLEETAKRRATELAYV